MPTPLHALMYVKVKDADRPDLFDLTISVLKEGPASRLQEPNALRVVYLEIHPVIARAEELGSCRDDAGELLSLAGCNSHAVDDLINRVARVTFIDRHPC